MTKGNRSAERTANVRWGRKKTHCFEVEARTGGGQGEGRLIGRREGATADWGHKAADRLCLSICNTNAGVKKWALAFAAKLKTLVPELGHCADGTHRHRLNSNVCER